MAESFTKQAKMVPLMVSLETCGCGSQSLSNRVSTMETQMLLPASWKGRLVPSRNQGPRHGLVNAEHNCVTSIH